MIFLGDLYEIESNIFGIGLQHYRIEDLGKTKEELETEGILVEELPLKKEMEGYYSQLRYNKDTKTVYWEYFKQDMVEQPKTEELLEENEKLKKELLDTQELLLNEKYKELIKEDGVN